MTLPTAHLSSASSVPSNLNQEEDELQEKPSRSRVHKLSKRLSSTFRSTLSLSKDANHQVNGMEHSDIIHKPEKTASLFKGFSMQNFFENNEHVLKGRSKSLLQDKTECEVKTYRAITTPPSFARSSKPYGKLDQYMKLERLGEGSYATVYKGVSRSHHIMVAMKEIRLQEEEGIPFTAIREASLLKELKHANIVTLHDIIPTKEHLVLVFEYLHTDLSIYLEERPFGLHPTNVKLLLFQLLRGVRYIHKKKILHRDLKPQNVLLNKKGELKLADFGLARAKSVPSHTYTNEIVTLWYRPPDVLLGSTEYSTSLDMWGVGCIFVELVCGIPLFPGVKSPHDQLTKIFRVCGTPLSWPNTKKCVYKPSDFEIYPKTQISKSAKRLLTIPFSESLAEQFIQLQPENRISAEEAMNHEYFKDLPEEIFSLVDYASIFIVKGIKMCKDHKRFSTAKNSKSFGQFV
ncbi:cyclin-dependent kinase 14 isoform X1 [Hydra vulgaris]|uniref:cyclin-dependent kinase 14 isoform X1 n=1 Tax=Hydra vulgaris TaxID=6087 RepID=UPI001F5F6B9A|nr:cyclin-dependent kinase 14-like [Hydra vulgaris]XP_047138559.1 cyclin-dependent kinase 14-like [Hydra vulgaris]XP_047138560.1 cyclin-dependent kinase 14-like [Hydra vulgaris]XP_047138561.1 cyclin-dependent kinase 14-like [Hydra vulgaris]